MSIFNKTFSLSSRQRCEMIDITGDVAAVLKRFGITAGTVRVYCPHTTAAITINENADPSVVHDMLMTLEELFPRDRPGYRHMEGNSDAHVKSSLTGCSEQVPIINGKMTLGTWQGIYFCEFDGPRTRRVSVHITGESTAK